MNITLVGTGNMGSAFAKQLSAAGHTVRITGRDIGKATALAAQFANVSAYPAAEALGDSDVVVVATAYEDAVQALQSLGDLSGKVLIDITNPLNFETFDSLVVPVGSSAAAELQAKLPGASVLKAFNTTFAATLASKQVGGLQTTVLIAGDDADAKAALADAITAGGVGAIDAGSLSRAHELEAFGFLQLTLAASEKIGWTGGFAVVK